MGSSLRLLYSVCSVCLVWLYTPYFRCVRCRSGLPPGLPLGICALPSSLLLHCLTSLAPSSRATLASIAQTLLCLLLQNILTLFWIQWDDFLLQTLSKKYSTEDEILRDWWFAMLSTGVALSLPAFLLTKCNRGHIAFENQFKIRHWTHYWTRLSKQVHFGTNVSLIPPSQVEEED